MRLLLALVGAALLGQAWAFPTAAMAAPPTASVMVGQPGSPIFVPSAANVRMGGTVTWTWATSSHSVTDSSGLGLYDSGVRSSGSTFSYTFIAAGKYHYVSPADPGVTGIVRVPIRVYPTTGASQTTFKITWASGPPPNGMDYFLENRRKPQDWSLLSRSSVTSLSRGFPNGTWEFRARLESGVTGAHGAWSPIYKLVVTLS